MVKDSCIRKTTQMNCGIVINQQLKDMIAPLWYNNELHTSQHVAVSESGVDQATMKEQSLNSSADIVMTYLGSFKFLFRISKRKLVI